MATDCESALAAYDKAHREVEEQFEELKLWATVAGVSITALLAALAAAVALLGTATIEAVTIAGIPLAILQGIMAILVGLVGLIAALSLLVSFVALIVNYIQWQSAKSDREEAMNDIRELCPREKWPPVPS